MACLAPTQSVTSLNKQQHLLPKLLTDILINYSGDRVACRTTVGTKSEQEKYRGMSPRNPNVCYHRKLFSSHRSTSDAARSRALLRPYAAELPATSASMAIHFKFKSEKDFTTLPIEGNFISVGNLKLAIVEQQMVGRTADFDLAISNAQTAEGSIPLYRVCVLTICRLQGRSRPYSQEHLRNSAPCPSHAAHRSACCHWPNEGWPFCGGGAFVDGAFRAFRDERERQPFGGHVGS
jgi:hypothetical protein